MHRSVLFSLIVLARGFALPLTFEERDSNRFFTRFGREAMEIQFGRIVLGDVTLRFAGSSKVARVEGLGPSAPCTYLRAGFTRTVRQFPKLVIRNLYPGIGAVFYGAGGNLEYDLTVAPGVSQKNIRISVEGSRAIHLDRDGNLAIQTSTGQLRQLRPRVFQHHREISARYALLARNEVGIRLGKYDPRSPLTIDPVLVSVNSFGGSGSSSAGPIAADAQGNLYVAGSSNSLDFPSTSHAFDPHVIPPLSVVSNAGKTVEELAVGDAASVGLVGGTKDGTVLYANTSNGLFVSGDGGNTWVQRAALSSGSGPYSFSQSTANSISLDPLDPATLIIATNYGIFGGGSGGEFLGLTNTGLSTSGDGYVSVYSAFYSPITPMIAYAVTTSPSLVYRSTDYANTWQQLNPAYTGEPAPPTDPFPQLVATLSPDGNTLYVIDGNGILLSSTDGGDSWTKLRVGFFNPIAIQVDPNNASAIYVVDYTGLHGSTDGGMTFSTVAIPPPAVGLAIDASGAVYVAGNTYTLYVSADHGKTLTPVSQLTGRLITNLATIAGKVFAGSSVTSVPFVVKLDPTGSKILYSTFLGGTVYDGINGIAVDAQGNAVVVGVTTSPDFPLTIPAASPPALNKPDAFIAKLNATGTSLIYSTAFGGTQGAGMQAVTLDSSGSPYVTGSSSSGDFPTTAGAFQSAIPSTQCPIAPSNPFLSPILNNYAFAAKLSADGSKLEYSTFLTGSCGSLAAGIAVDSSGDAVVVGYTTSLDFPVSAGSYQSAFPGNPNLPYPAGTFDAGFVTKLNPTGTRIIASSYLGGGYTTQASAVALDSSGDPYITGSTQGFSPGATPGIYQTKIVDNCAPTISIGPGLPYTGTGDAFVLKLNPTLSAAQFLTYLGGSCNDSGASLALDSSGDIWVTGATASPDFPLKEPFGIGGGNFIAEFSPDASRLLFSSSNNGVNLAITSQAVFLTGGIGNLAAVTKIDPTTAPAIEIDSVTSVAVLPAPSVNPNSVAIAPGLLVQINGNNLGPTAKLNAQVDATGRLPFELGGTIVYFDNLPAALVSVSASSIVCYVPFEAASTTEVTVAANGQVSNAVAMSVSPSAPQILSVINQDGTLNSAQHPAKVGSVVTLYVSGLGETNPPSADGLTNAPPLAVPVAQVIVYLPTTSASIVIPQFSGAAPGLIAGITQINVPLAANTLVGGGTAIIGVNSAIATLYVTQ